MSGEHRHLASVQAAMILSVVHSISGLDKIGDIYSLEGYAIAHEMDLFDGNEHIRPHRVRNAWNFTASCLFGWDRYVMYALSTTRCMTDVGALAM